MKSGWKATSKSIGNFDKTCQRTHLCNFHTTSMPLKLEGREPGIIKFKLEKTCIGTASFNTNVRLEAEN